MDSDRRGDAPNGPGAPSQPGAIASALGRIPSGLFVITWVESAQDRGMLASWVMQAGFEPPAITIAIGHNRGGLSALDGEPFVVNILGESQRPLLARFGRPSGEGGDPFTGLATSRSPRGLAILEGAVGWIECVPRDRASSGDHRLIVANVTEGGAADGDARPLVHMRKNGLRY